MTTNEKEKTNEKETKKKKGTWGGVRAGAGRPRKDDLVGPGVPHLQRPDIADAVAAHASWRLYPETWFPSLAPWFDVLDAIFLNAARPGFRVAFYAIIGDRLHLVVEADERKLLGRRMQGLGVSIATRLNQVLGRDGRAFYDRYQLELLRSGAELAKAQALLAAHGGRDPAAPPATSAS